METAGNTVSEIVPRATRTLRVVLSFQAAFGRSRAGSIVSLI
jgi:hypothetical protein